MESSSIASRALEVTTSSGADRCEIDSIAIIDPKVTGILTAHRERVFRLFDLVW